MKLEGKTALVTGASRGIGRAIALAFAREGARVAINYRANEEAAHESKALADAAGPAAILVQADVTVRSQVEAMLDACLNEFGRLDILVNNASGETGRPFWEMTEELWDFVVDSTLKSVFLCTRAAVPHMMERRSGKVLNISSIHDAAPRALASAYCAAKAGLLMLTRCCALELAAYNIQVNAISPGLIDTDRTAGYIRRGNRQGLTNIPTAIPAHRAGRPEEIAEAALYMVGDAAGYTTGTTMYIDGGYLTNTCRIP
jgi:3-oxoacyl-[acyl-carrier protein] reductase